MTRDARPGQRFQIAVFAMNGPVSTSPNNFIWIRSATLDFYRPSAGENVGSVVRLDPGLDAIVAKVADFTVEFASWQAPRMEA